MSSASAFNADILSQIFLLCVAPQGGTFLLKEEPWTLGQVCGHWRNIVLNTAVLWNSIHIKDSDAKNISHASPILIEALRRSGTSKLHVYVSTGVVYGEKEFDAQPLYDLVQDRCEDWESLRLDGYAPVPAIIPLQPRLSSLRRCDIEVGINFRGKLGTGTLNHLIQSVQRAPLVGAVRFSGTALSAEDLWSGDISGNVWSNLRHLELSSYENAELTSILSCCSSRLESLVLSGSSTTISKNGGVFHLPRLRSLQLDHFLPTWWTRLSCPGITSLTIKNLSIRTDILLLTEILKQRGSSLRTISFLDVEFRDVTVEEMLQLAPFVTTFTITGTTFPYIFDRLASDASLLPRMETLIVRPSDQTSNNIQPIPPVLDAVVRAVESRSHILKAVKVEALYGHADRETVDRLRGIHNRGIAVEVNILKVTDNGWGDMSEAMLLVQVIFAFNPLFSNPPDVKNPEEVYFLCAYLLDILEDENRYGLDLIKKCYSHDLHDFAKADLPGAGGASVMRRFKALMDKWESIASPEDANE
ncbi:hypothetical protein WG66_004261 [Moniliophthora roreri]|uniref:F-box domain-containing protein n=1 Tax=Moniliophthora roreri TaxID=221103 RepID=A0A0W0EYE5_MONRR|nr:hypothetical protein WG66_004261 [Moniliophthora roreri]